MGKAARLMAAVGLVLAACSGGDAVESTTTTSTTSTSTTTLVATSTTEPPTEDCEPTPLEGRSQAWESGCVYTAESFVVPHTFYAPGPGWTSSGAASRWVEIRHDADGDDLFDVSLTFVVYEDGSTPGAVADSIVAIEAVDLVSGPDESAIRGNAAIVVDVLGQPDDSVPERDPCSGPSGTSRFFNTAPGYVLFVEPDLPSRQTFGVPACFATRIWVMDVNGTSVTALGVVKDNDRFDELMPILEDFLQNSVTFGDNDG